MDISKLKEPFDPALISWRVGATDKKKQQRIQNNQQAKATCGIALAYIDARDVMQRLDDVCGLKTGSVSILLLMGKHHAA